MTEREIFTAALTKGSPAERAAFLDEACAGDASLRQRVESLLSEHGHLGSFMDVLSRVETLDSSPLERPGTVIGPYRLLQQIGEGGMGTVFMAEQTHPVQRKVALKVIKPGMDSRQVIARFEAERQALAMMDHVNIARVLDAGATESGRPYFVMELVHGLPITKYCDGNRLTPRQRLELFVPVCQAIQHAHQKGIIHRDIKPSNVMITLYDGKPVAKVIDFGVAKATEQTLTERTLFTQYGTMVGTFEYMSPEQAEMSALGVDTRSDIYSLGVLLYELLTGSTPLSHSRMKEAAYGEILRMIKEEEPPKPSTRLSDSGEALASISAQRQTEPAKLTRLVRGELDWIVMKALEKDRNDRYETANGFAADVQRYLNDEPVQACPPSAGYKFRKYFHKHKSGVLLAAAFMALLVSGAVVSAWQAVRATVAEGKANDDCNRAVAAEDAAKISEAKARDEARRAKESESDTRAVLEFFQEKVLAAARPEDLDGGLGIDASIRAAVDAAEPQIAPAFLDRPLVEASIRNSLGESYLYLGEPALATRQLERSRQLRLEQLGPDHPDTLTSMNNLAWAYVDAGRLDEALLLGEQTLEKRKVALGIDHADTLTSMNDLAGTYYAAGKLDQARQLWEQTLEKRKATLGPDHLDTLTSMSDVATAYHATGKLDKALPLREQSLEKLLATVGPDHPNTLIGMNNMATAYQAAGKFDQALPLLEKALEKQRVAIGPDHPHTLGSMSNLAATYKAAGKFDKAMALDVETLERRKATVGPDHPDTLNSMNNLATDYREMGQVAEAEPLFRDAVAGARAKLGLEHSFTQTYMRNLADCYDRLHQSEKAELIWRELATFWKEKAGADSPQYAAELHPIGASLLAQNKPADAEPLLRECLAIREKTEPDAWATFCTKSVLGGSLLGQKKFAEAEPLLLAGYEGLKQVEAKTPQRDGDQRLRESLERLAQLYEATGNEEKAAEWRKKFDELKSQESEKGKQ